MNTPSNSKKTEETPLDRIIVAAGSIEDGNFQYVRVESELLSLAIKAGPKEHAPIFPDESETIIKLSNDNELTVDGDDLPSISLLTADPENESSARLYNSWLFLRTMIEEWLLHVPNECKPSVSFFYIKEETPSRIIFLALFRASDAQCESVKSRGILSGSAREWGDYVQQALTEETARKRRRRSSPTDRKQNNQNGGNTGNVPPPPQRRRSFNVDSTPFLDCIPVVGGCFDYARGVKAFKNKSVVAGVAHITLGTANIAFDLVTLGVGSLVKNGVKSVAQIGVKQTFKAGARSLAEQGAKRIIINVTKKVAVTTARRASGRLATQVFQSLT